MLRKLAVLALALVVTAGLAACGGGGGGSSSTSKKISGVAAAGGPIVGMVTIRDSSNPPIERNTDIEADGSYSVSVAGLTAPYAMRAVGDVGGRRYVLYSAATSTDVNGTVNITPFTDLILANIAADLAASYFDNDQFSGLSDEALDAAMADLRTQLLPILTEVGLSASLDLLRASFAADHSGLDAVLDMVQVETDPDTLTAAIVNITTGNTVTADIANGGFTGAFTQADGEAVAAGMTDIQQIVAGMEIFTNLYANSVPGPTNPTLLALFDQPNFLQSGQNFDQFIGQITSDPGMEGITFGNVRIVAFHNQGLTCEVAFETSLNGNVLHDAPTLFYFNKVGGVWKNAGDQRIGSVTTEVRMYYFPGTLGGQFQTGMTFHIRDDGRHGIDHAIVTGPGLPEGGLRYNSSIEWDHFILEGNEDHDLYEMGDAQIDEIPLLNAEYTIVLYDDQDQPMDAPYVQTIIGRPYKISELSASMFPSVTAPTPTQLGAWTGGNLTVRWTKPAGSTSDYVWLYVQGDGGSVSTETNMLSPTATQATLNITSGTFPEGVFYKSVNVGTDDGYYRMMTTVIYWQQN